MVSHVVRSRTFAPAIGALITLAAPQAARAQAVPAVGYRAGVIKSAATTPRGTVVLESGASGSWEPARRLLRAGEMTLKVPVAPRADLRIGFSSYRWAHSATAHVSGYEDMTVSSVVRLRDRAAHLSLAPRLAVTVGTTLPTGAPELRAEALRPQLRVAADWALPRATLLAVNVAAVRDQAVHHPIVETTAGAMATHRLHSRMNVYVEGYAVQRRNGAVTVAEHLHGGITTLLTSSLHLDLHAGRRLDTGAQSLGIGFAQRWFTSR